MTGDNGSFLSTHDDAQLLFLLALDTIYAFPAHLASKGWSASQPPSELHVPTAHWQSDCPLGACSQVCPRPYVICLRQCASVNISVTTSCGGQVFPFAPSKKKAVVVLEVPPSSSDSNATIWYDGSVTIVANNKLDWLRRLTVWLYSTHLKWWKESQTGWSRFTYVSWAGISYNNVEQPCGFHPIWPEKIAQRCAVKAPHASSAESTSGMKPCVGALTTALHDISKIKTGVSFCKILYVHIQEFYKNSLYCSYDFNWLHVFFIAFWGFQGWPHCDPMVFSKFHHLTRCYSIHMELLAESSKNNAAKTLILHAWARWLVQNDASNEPVSVAALSTANSRHLHMFIHSIKKLVKLLNILKNRIWSKK